MSGKIAAKEAALLKGMPEKLKLINNEIHKRIIGQDELIAGLMAALLCRGHCLLIGVPGLAKTLLVHTIGEIAELQFSRIQFTPDMMPSDITGSEILEEDHATGKRQFMFMKGPVFAQLVLADEINRTSPKTQSALLEAMQEHRVTVAGKKYQLPDPFFVLATQNPIEQEGTYPLPEAQLDRFMFCLNVSYPKFDEEVDVLLSTTQDGQQELSKVVTGEEFIALQAAVRQVPVPKSVAEYAAKLVRATRPGEGSAPEFVEKYLRWGAGPRACQYLALAGKVFAVLDGRLNVAIDDIKRAAHPVLRHRIILNYRAEADKRSPDDLITELMEGIK
ncbi:MAG TPA: AAA family ATPase [Lentisphaeria bacterium]|nr:MAG: AAA family ATPase [Lentisphaerae bacterium GWF2_49_21]HBC88612.1 AAA family ATPase [Lentisphaeria bacterium]